MTTQRAKVALLLPVLLAFTFGSIAASNDSVYVKVTFNLPCESDDMVWCLNHPRANDKFTTINAVTGTNDQFTTSKAITGIDDIFTTTSKIATKQNSGNFVTSSDMTIGVFTSPAISGQKLAMSAEEVVTVKYAPITTEILEESMSGIEEHAHTPWDLTGTAYAKVENIALTSPGFVAFTNTTPELRTFTTTIYSNGFCDFSYDFLSRDAIMTFQKVYASFYLISFIVVLAIYFRIYVFVVRRRRMKRQKISVVSQPKEELAEVPNPKTETTLVFNAIPSASCCHDGSITLNEYLKKQTRFNQNYENVIHKERKMESKKSVLVDSGTRSKYETKRGKTNNDRGAESLLSANVRTAAMLFVVTLVFILCFLPAWLMAVGVIETQLLVFYAYFFYNVANPMIYAFMNPMYRKEMKRLFRIGVSAQRWS